MSPKHYIGADCRRQHGGLRYKSNKACVECSKHSASEWETANAERRATARLKRFAVVYAKPEHWAKMLLWRTQRRCRIEGIAFDLTIDDCKIPERCPVLGIELKVGGGRNCPTSPSLDRLVPSLGYIKGNVRVISWRANEIKGDATPDELAAVLDYVRKNVA